MLFTLINILHQAAVYHTRLLSQFFEPDFLHLQRFFAFRGAIFKVLDDCVLMSNHTPKITMMLLDCMRKSYTPFLRALRQFLESPQSEAELP